MERRESYKNKKQEAYLISFILMALYFSLLENLIPKPFPWMKLGLANLAGILAMQKFGSRMAYKVLFFRIFIQGLMLGTLFTPGFFVSLGAGFISTSLMCFLYKFNRHFSLVAISSSAAVSHNISQLFLVYIFFFRGIELYSRSVLIFVAIFLAIGFVSGAVIGVLAEKLKIRNVSSRADGSLG